MEKKDLGNSDEEQEVIKEEELNSGNNSFGDHLIE